MATSATRRSHVAADAPIDKIQSAALHHPDPFVRRGCVGFPDHYANEASTAVFAQALHDPGELVRHATLHSVACETCRSEELCVTDVVPHVIDLLAADPSLELRHKAIPVLLRLAEVWVFDPDLRLVLLVNHRWRGWVPPGGKVDVGETPREAAVRELLEETGLHVELRRRPAAVRPSSCSRTECSATGAPIQPAGDEPSMVTAVGRT